VNDFQFLLDRPIFFWRSLQRLGEVYLRSSKMNHCGLLGARFLKAGPPDALSVAHATVSKKNWRNMHTETQFCSEVFRRSWIWPESENDGNHETPKNSQRHHSTTEEHSSG